MQMSMMRRLQLILLARSRANFHSLACQTASSRLRSTLSWNKCTRHGISWQFITRICFWIRLVIGFRKETASLSAHQGVGRRVGIFVFVLQGSSKDKEKFEMVVRRWNNFWVDKFLCSRTLLTYSRKKASDESRQGIITLIGGFVFA